MRRFGSRLVVGVLALVTLVAVGAYTYNLGVARGLMEPAELSRVPARARAAFEEWHRRAHASPERGSAEP